MATFEDVNDFCRLCKENCRIKGRGRVNGWGPHSPPGGFNSAGPVRGDPFAGLLPGRSRPPPGAFPPRSVRRERVGLEGPGAKVARGSGSELCSASARTSPLPRAEDKVPAAPSLPSGRDEAPNQFLK